MSLISNVALKGLAAFLTTLWMAHSADCAESTLPPGDCPQPRFTERAPADVLNRSNPLPPTPSALAEGASLYGGKGHSIACVMCHGTKGDGKGPLASQYIPRPRNFACRETIINIPDGQLFWIIRNGSPGTAMPPSSALSDQQIWQLVLHLRQLAKPQ